MEKQSAAGQRSDAKQQRVAAFENENQSQHRQVAQKRDAEFEPECFAHDGGAAFLLIDKMANHDAVESETRHYGKHSHEREADRERAKSLRTKMATQRDNDRRERSDAHNVVE